MVQMFKKALVTTDSKTLHPLIQVDTRQVLVQYVLAYVKKLLVMDNAHKMQIMDKMVRELDDIVNSQTALLKKIAQLEADNINLGDKVLEEKLPDLHEHVDAALTEATEIQTAFQETRDKFASTYTPEEV